MKMLPAYMILSVITNDYVQSVSKTKHIKLQDSPVVSPPTADTDKITKMM